MWLSVVSGDDGDVMKMIMMMMMTTMLVMIRSNTVRTEEHEIILLE